MITIKESKQLRYKTISELFQYIDSLPINWIFVDTETSGLGGARIQQLTQVSAIVLDNTNFNEVDTFDEKIELNDTIKNRMELDNEFPKGIKAPGQYIEKPWSTKKILKFNHYTSGNYQYKDEKEVVNSFFNWLDKYNPYTLVAQNASFDMSMLGGRFKNKINSPVLDTKVIIQYFFIPLLQKLAEKDNKYQKMIDQLGTSNRDYGLPSSSMGKIAPVLGIDMDNYHDALTDCRITIKMIKKILDILKSYKNVDISQYQLLRIKKERLNENLVDDYLKDSPKLKDLGLKYTVKSVKDYLKNNKFKKEYMPFPEEYMLLNILIGSKIAKYYFIKCQKDRGSFDTWNWISKIRKEDLDNFPLPKSIL